jgi:lipid-binding SYLF domain-containing protein
MNSIKGESKMKITSSRYLLVQLFAVLALLFTTVMANAETAAEIDRSVDNSLEMLYSNAPVAKELSKSAKGILVFPNVIKAGLIIGGQYGVGALRIDGKTAGYYSTVAASYGLQAGAQSFGYTMFLMSKDALRALDTSSGWEVGVGPSIVVVDEGMAKSLTTSTLKDDVYVFFTNQKGLMAGLGVQGTKITGIKPDK